MRATFDNFALDVLVFAILSFTAVLFALYWARVRRQREKHVEPGPRAMRDALTGLPNRAAAWEQLDRCFADRDAVAALGGIAVLRIDMDGFKSVNDRLGHGAGDDLLRQVARRIAASLRDTDFVARLDGDEFLVILPQESNRENTSVVANKLVATLGAEYQVLENADCQLTVSMGISRCPDDAWTREDLLKCADLALAQAKLTGRNKFRFFEPAVPGRP